MQQQGPLKEIIEQAKFLDSDALSEIFRHYYPKIFRYLSYRTKTTDEAEDLASEVFVKVVKSIKGQSGNFEAWLYTIAKNTLTDFYRRKGSRTEMSLDENVASVVPSGKDVDTSSFTQEELKKGLSELTEDQREVIILKFIEGNDNEEIAQIMGKNIGAIKALQFRALLALREILKEN